MSLKAWYTFNNNYKNQGIGDLDLAVSTSPSYVNGKVGKALSTGGFTWTAEQTASILNNEALSICFWIYVVDGSDRKIIFGNDSLAANNNRKFAIFQYPTENDLHLYWMNDTANTTLLSASVVYGAFPTGQWTHCAITYSNPTCKIYINGVLKETWTGTSNSSTFAYKTQVVHSSSSRYMNDMRFYDHCLSAKEVKEISKGLILHYPLSSPYETGMKNIYSGTAAKGNATGHDDNWTITKLADEPGYNYKYSYTGTGSSKWTTFNFGNFSFTAGKKYYYSCKVRCRSANFIMDLRASRNHNDYFPGVSIVAGVLNNKDGEWHEYYASQTINSTFSDYSGGTITSNPVLEFYSENLNTSGKVYTADFDIKDVQVIESNEYVPFIDNTMVTTAVSDCSGYGNNGTRSGTLSYSPSSPRYDGCFEFSGSQFIKDASTRWQAGSINDITISVWVKPNAVDCGGVGGIMYDVADHNATCISLYNTQWQFLKRSDITWLNISNGGNTVGQWAHHACTLKDGVAKVYKDGSLISTTTVGAIISEMTSNTFFCIGCDFPGGHEYMNGSISDFRIYATALSDADIKQLYNSPISVDKSGNLYCNEFKEGL